MLLPYIHELYDWCAFLQHSWLLWRTKWIWRMNNGKSSWSQVLPNSRISSIFELQVKKYDRSTLIFQATIDKMTRIEVINDEGETINVIRIWTDAHRCEDFKNTKVYGYIISFRKKASGAKNIMKVWCHKGTTGQILFLSERRRVLQRLLKRTVPKGDFLRFAAKELRISPEIMQVNWWSLI